MSNDSIKKQRPNDGSSGSSGDDSQDKNDEFGMDEFGYDLDSKKEEDTGKKKKGNDESEYEEESAKSRKKEEEYKERLDDIEELKKMREEKKEKDLKIAKDREKKREEEQKEKEKQWENSDREKKEQEEKLIAGEKIEKKRVFRHKGIKGVFRHEKITLNASGRNRINKALKKIHGVSLKKRQMLTKLARSYSPSKTVLRKDHFGKFIRGFRSKRFSDPNFKRMIRDGIDLKSARGGLAKEILRS